MKNWFGLLLTTLVVVTPPLTTLARPADQEKPAGRQRIAASPSALPGYKLDTHFRDLPAPDPAVYRAVPAWLKARKAGRPVYVVDGRVATPAQLRRLRPEQAASVVVVPNHVAAERYGPVAREGMVAVTTKAAGRPPKRP